MAKVAIKNVKKEILKPEEIIAQIKAKGEFEHAAERTLELRNVIVDGDLDLSDSIIKASLDFDGCEFRGWINLSRSVFEGSYISLDRAIIMGRLCANGLECKRGFSLYLRNAKVGQETNVSEESVSLVGINRIHWLCIGGLKYYKGKKWRPIPPIRTGGSEIDSISTDPSLQG